MSSSLFQLDITNKDHLKLLKEFEKEHKGIIIEEPSSDNEFNICLFNIKENKINELCLLQGQKDIKICTITCEEESRKIILPATAYALDTLNMEEVFIKVKEDDKLSINLLNKNEYECLGEENGSIIYLQERKEVLEKHRNR